MKNRKIILALSIIAVLGVVGTSAYLLGKRSDKKDGKANTTVQQPNETTKTNSADTKTPASDTTLTKPSGQTASINKYEPAGLFNASFTRKVTDFTPWQDSPVAVEYRDFNEDGVMDAFVSGKIPGTQGYSFASIWTMNGDAPKELWYLPSDQYLVQSSWAVSSINTLVNSGKIDEGGIIKNTTNNWHWQVSTTGSGVVLEPNI